MLVFGDGKTFQGKNFKIFKPMFSTVLTFLTFQPRRLDRCTGISDWFSTERHIKQLSSTNGPL